MTLKQATNLKEDIGKNIRPFDYCEDVYLSIKGIGNKSFRNCTYLESEGWLFIWTESESFIINTNDIGDFIFIPVKSCDSFQFSNHR